MVLFNARVLGSGCMSSARTPARSRSLWTVPGRTVFSFYGTASPWYPFIMESQRPNCLFSRIREAVKHLLRRQPLPAMIGTPPSQRPTWHDPAAHARDFAERYATELDYAVSQRESSNRRFHPQYVQW
jgi:hypothetical protein